MIRIHVFIGSESDQDIVAESCLKKLREIGLGYDLNVCSAHRDPEELPGLVQDALAAGVELFIGYAGLTPALPGAIASHARHTPVIGVSDSQDEHRAITNTAPGVPVAYTGWGKNGLVKAAELAAQILGTSDPAVLVLQTEYINNTRIKKPPKPHLLRWDPEEANA